MSFLLVTSSTSASAPTKACSHHVLLPHHIRLPTTPCCVTITAEKKNAFMTCGIAPPLAFLLRLSRLWPPKTLRDSRQVRVAVGWGSGRQFVSFSLRLEAALPSHHRHHQPVTVTTTLHHGSDVVNFCVPVSLSLHRPLLRAHHFLPQWMAARRLVDFHSENEPIWRNKADVQDSYFFVIFGLGVIHRSKVIAVRK
ncbi:hypothetical protein E2C01_017620 [Portunus trituberculatus]|uniref:PI-PLC Y-box domain-containing protein n=1 Tax=Portunus trituberculatus TaxID=210409 RepID=A0A5B7DUB4_PORTR|nr:hypothetical protein [Portunus trituberculatus]